MKKALVVALLAGLILTVGAGSGQSADHFGGPGPWRDHGFGHWFDRVCSLPGLGSRVAGCGALVVTNSKGTRLASSTPPSGALGPAQFHSAYNLPTTTSAGTPPTIGIVDAYDDPNIASDLATYSNQYGLPACTTSNGCFTKLNQNGGTSYPRSNSNWALEISLDVEMAHAICQNCKILLVEASSASLADLGAAENEAVALGATVISNSWGASEYSSETSDEASYFHHPGVAITASAGDSGYGVEFPAASQYVTAVGGTTLNLNGNGSYASETVWSGTGSGCSRYEPKPSWQHDTGCANRTVGDVAADADPNTGAAVYDSVSSFFQRGGWYQVGGTSVASPLIAAVYALAGSPQDVVYGSAPYANPSLLHDVTSGSNGNCGGSYLCTAGTGYDGPTGLGTPNGVGAFTGTPITKPGAPTGLTATAANGSVHLSWTAPGNTGGASVTYDVYRGDTGAGSEAATPIATGVSGTTLDDTGLTNGTTYYYEVTAVNSAGEGPASGEADATPQAVKPGAPTGLGATAGDGVVHLVWTAPADNGGSAIQHYNVYRGSSSGTETLYQTLGNVTSYDDTAVTNGDTYYYTVSAVNGIGEGPQSGEAHAMPQAAAKPGAPTGLTASVSGSSIHLSWSAPSSDGGSTITNYKVYRGTSSGTETLYQTLGNVTSWDDTSVSQGSTYWYTVSAVNGVGEGPQSGEASASLPTGDFSLSISPTSGFLGPSGSTTYTVTITPSNGFSGQVTLGVSGLPSGVSWSFSPNPATSSTTLTLTNSGSGFARVTFTVTGTSGALSHSATASLFVW